MVGADGIKGMSRKVYESLPFFRALHMGADGIKGMSRKVYESLPFFRALHMGADGIKGMTQTDGGNSNRRNIDRPHQTPPNYSHPNRWREQ